MPLDPAGTFEATSAGYDTSHTRIRALELAMELKRTVAGVTAEEVLKDARLFAAFLAGDDKLTPDEVDQLPKSE